MLKNTLIKFLYLYSILFASCMILSTSDLFSADSTKIWVGTWSTGPQLVESGNMPPSPGLNNNSLRQVVRVSIGGDTLRFKISNEFSEDTVVMKAVKFSLSAGGSAIYDSTTVKLLFDGNPEVAMAPGTAVTSDPFAFNLEPRMDIAITIYFGQTSETTTGHPGSRTTSYLIAGNDTSVTDFTGATTADRWYNINGIDVWSPPTFSCVAIIGNSITGGRGSTTNMQNRWPDNLSVRLLGNAGTEEVGVLNMGIGGNCVLSFCLGPSGVDRYERDILNQQGVRAAIIFEGVNDIGGQRDPETLGIIGTNLIEAYKMMIDSAHARNINIYGATITPFKGNGYYNAYSERCRNRINNWIRSSGRFDAVIDFDMAMRSSTDTARLIASYQNDGLHPDADGYVRMADSIDLSLFEGLDTLMPVIDTSESEHIWLEAECALVGENWELFMDPLTSNDGYLSIAAGLSSPSAAPDDTASVIEIPFTVSYDSTYNIYARVNCASTDEDSYWIKMDDGVFVQFDGLGTSGWEWKKTDGYSLTTGEHTLTIAYSEEGAKLDKLCITNDTIAPIGIGRPSDIICIPDTVTPAPPPVGVIDAPVNIVDYNLEQNYPNPFSDVTQITFEIPYDTYVSLKVFSMLGKEVAELAGKELTSGKHVLEFNATGLSKGIYFYTLKTDNYSASRKMIVQSE